MPELENDIDEDDDDPFATAARPSFHHTRSIEWPDPSTIEGITEHQRSELAKSMVGNIGLFSGLAGTGKTHSLARLIKTVVDQNPHAQIRMMAPTGKAAQRMSEMTSEIGLSVRGTTIHTGLVPQRNGHDGGGWGFFHNESNPLYAHLVILDESPMISADLMRPALSAINPGTKVLFVGDTNQLAPVGKGRPYADMIEAGLPHGHLTELHRFAGRIARVCKQICNGEHWTPSPKIDLDAEEFPENMRHVECNDSQRIETLKKVLEQLRGNRGFDLYEDVQVLCATNDLRVSLNAFLQTMLNPHGETVKGSLYRLNDKVICTRNQWIDQDWDERRRPVDNPKHYIANGESGVVSKIDSTFVAIDVDGGGTRKTLRFPKSSWVDVDLAYAITVWKAQGSQWKAVIPVTENNADRFVDRSYWNTAFSRGGVITLSLGRRAVIDRQCMRAGLQARKTLLKEKIQKWLKPADEEQEEQEHELELASQGVTDDDDFSDV